MFKIWIEHFEKYPVLVSQIQLCSFSKGTARGALTPAFINIGFTKSDLTKHKEEKLSPLKLQSFYCIGLPGV